MKIRVPGKPVGFLKITLKCTQKVTFERRWLRFVTYFKSNIDLLCISIKTGIFIIRQIYFRCPLPLHTYHHDQLMNVSFFLCLYGFFIMKVSFYSILDSIVFMDDWFFPLNAWKIHRYFKWEISHMNPK